MLLDAWMFVVPAFLLGLLFGSFLNVCISRLPEHRSIAKPRSHCPECQTVIRWYDNVPLLSFVLLRAKCRKCGVGISWRYPLVELAVGLWFGLIMGTALRSSPGSVPSVWIYFFGVGVLGFLLIGLAVMDWRTHTLPDAFTIPGIGIGFFLVCVQAIFLAPGEDDIKLNPKHSLRMSSPGSFVAKGNVFLTGPEHLVFGRLAAIVGAGMLLVVVNALYKAVRKRQGIGMGDAKLLAMIAAFLGFAPAMLALFVGVVLCSVYAVGLLARGRATGGSRLPLGTFLAVGGLVAAVFGNSLIGWYSSLL